MQTVVETAGQLVVFLVCDQLYALPIEETMEIIRIPTITEVPGVQHFMAGVIHLRGNIVPVVDLRKRFNMPTKAITKSNRILIAELNGEHIGLIIDEIRRVARVEKSNLEEAHTMSHFIQQQCFRGFARTDEGIIGILRLANVLNVLNTTSSGSEESD